MTVLPSFEAQRWLVATLNADTTLAAAIAGGKVWRPRIPRDLSIKDAPGVTVGIQSTTPPIGYVGSGRPMAYESQSVTLRVQVVHQSESSKTAEGVMARIASLLDGAANAVTANGIVWQCMIGPTIDMPDTSGDATIQQITTLWYLEAKAS